MAEGTLIKGEMRGFDCLSVGSFLLFNQRLKTCIYPHTSVNNIKRGPQRLRIFISFDPTVHRHTVRMQDPRPCPCMPRPRGGGDLQETGHSGNLGLWWSPVWDSEFQRLLRICWRDENFQEKAQWTYRCCQG